MSARDHRRLSRGYRRAVESRSRIRYRLRLEANLACNVLELSECQTCSRQRRRWLDTALRSMRKNIRNFVFGITTLTH